MVVVVVVVTILFDYLYSFELMNLNVFIGLAVDRRVGRTFLVAI